MDPVEPEKVMKAAHAHGVRIISVLTTHKHSDHAGGNAEMARQFPDIDIIGGKGAPMRCLWLSRYASVAS